MSDYCLPEKDVPIYLERLLDIFFEMKQRVIVVGDGWSLPNLTHVERSQSETIPEGVQQYLYKNRDLLLVLPHMSVIYCFPLRIAYIKGAVCIFIIRHLSDFHFLSSLDLLQETFHSCFIVLYCLSPCLESYKSFINFLKNQKPFQNDRFPRESLSNSQNFESLPRAAAINDERFSWTDWKQIAALIYKLAPERTEIIIDHYICSRRKLNLLYEKSRSNGEKAITHLLELAKLDTNISKFTLDLANEKPINEKLLLTFTSLDSARKSIGGNPKWSKGYYRAEKAAKSLESSFLQISSLSEKISYEMLVTLTQQHQDFELGIFSLPHLQSEGLEIQIVIGEIERLLAFSKTEEIAALRKSYARRYLHAANKTSPSHADLPTFCCLLFATLLDPAIHAACFDVLKELLEAELRKLNEMRESHKEMETLQKLLHELQCSRDRQA